MASFVPNIRVAPIWRWHSKAGEKDKADILFQEAMLDFKDHLSTQDASNTLDDLIRMLDRFSDAEINYSKKTRALLNEILSKGICTKKIWKSMSITTTNYDGVGIKSNNDSGAIIPQAGASDAGE